MPRRLLFPAMAALVLGALAPSEAAAKGPAAVTVTIDGVPLAAPDRLRRVTVEQTLDAPDAVVVELADPGAHTGVPPVMLGAALAVHPGADDRSPPIFRGEVVGIEPLFARGGPVIVLRGYDLSHRLTRGRRTRTWHDASDAELARALAHAHGLEADAMDAGFRSAVIYQRNQSDLEFLRERAQRIGWTIAMDGPVLRFAPPGPDPVAVLSLGRELLSFQPRLGSASQVARVVVRGWDPVNKLEIVGEAGAAGAPPEATLLFDWADPLSEEPLLAEGRVFSAQEAALLAHAALAGAGPGGSGVARGTPELRAGSTIELEGVGTRFSGRYLVTRATHVFEPGGYSTRFEVRKEVIPSPAAPSR